MELLDDKVRIWIASAKFVKPVSGVYVFYNRSKEPIYIGETNNLEKTFTKYVDTDFEGNECKQKTHSYQREFTRALRFLGKRSTTELNPQPQQPTPS